jgi:hypothetical protein
MVPCTGRKPRKTAPFTVSVSLVCCLVPTCGMLRRALQEVYHLTAGSLSITITPNNASSIGLDVNTLGHLFRRSHEYKYCESKYGSVFSGHISLQDSATWRDEPGAPFIEWGAVTSAAFISMCGCHMLMFWRHDSTMLHLIASLFVVNGVGAAMAHYTNLTSWHRIDGMSMALSAWISAGFLSEEFVENLYKKRSREGRRAVWRMVIWCLYLFVYFWFAEANAVVPAATWGSNRAFAAYELGDHIAFLIIAIPLLFVVLMALVIIWRGWLMHTYVDQRVALKARRLFLRGLLIACVGVVSWLLTEQLCDEVKWVRYFPGHFVWHITMSYGLTMMLLLGGVLRADNFKMKPRIWRPRNSKGCCQHGAYKYLLTSLYFDILPEFAHVDPDLHHATGFENAALSAICKVKRAKQNTRDLALRRYSGAGTYSTPNLKTSWYERARKNVRGSVRNLLGTAQSVGRAGSSRQSPPFQRRPSTCRSRLRSALSASRPPPVAPTHWTSAQGDMCVEELGHELVRVPPPKLEELQRGGGMTNEESASSNLKDADEVEADEFDELLAGDELDSVPVPRTLLRRGVH